MSYLAEIHNSSKITQSVMEQGFQEIREMFMSNMQQVCTHRPNYCVSNVFLSYRLLESRLTAIG